MHIHVGLFRYDITANHEELVNEALDPVVGLAWPDLHKIVFSMQAPPDKRLAVVWHEIAHLLKADLDIRGHRGEDLDEESMCNLIGLAMSMMSPMDVARIHIYATQGIDAAAAILHPGLPHPIPVLQFSLPN